MPSQKDIDDLLASKEILEANIELFHSGKRELYRVIAAELRKLTCDRDSTLLPRIFPNVEMHPLLGRLPDELIKNAILYIPSVMEFDGKGGSRVTHLFNITAKRIPLDEWLEQNLFNGKITIRKLIKSVADKEAAHSDREYDDTLKFSKSVKMVDEDLHKNHIVAIGEYILQLISGSVQMYPNVFSKNVI